MFIDYFQQGEELRSRNSCDHRRASKNFQVRSVPSSDLLAKIPTGAPLNLTGKITSGNNTALVSMKKLQCLHRRSFPRGEYSRNVISLKVRELQSPHHSDIILKIRNMLQESGLSSVVVRYSFLPPPTVDCFNPGKHL